MKLTREDRTKMAKDNYWKNKEQIKANKGTPPTITSSSMRQGAGKGDANRISNNKRFKANYGAINWNSKKKG